MTRKLLSLILYVFAFFLIFCAVLTTIVSYLLKDLKYYTELTLELVEEKTGYNVSIGDINWSFAKGAGLQIDNLRITDTDRQKLIFSSKKVHLLTALSPLFKKHIKVSKILFDEPEISIVREKDGRWNVFTPPPVKFQDASRYGKFFDFSILLKKFYIKNGRLLYRDNLHDVTSDFEHIDLQMELNRKTKTYSISARSEHKERKGEGSLSFEGNFPRLPADMDFKELSANGNLVLNSISLARFMPYIKRLIPFPETDALFNANINFSLDPGWKFKATGHITSDSLSVSLQDRKPVNFGKCIFNFNVKADRDSFRCDRLTFSLPGGINLDGKLSLTKLQEESPFLDIKLGTSWFNITSLKQYADATNILTAPPGNILQKIEGGKMLLKNIRIQGHLNELSPEQMPVLHGELELKNTLIATREHLHPLKITSASFEMDKDNITGVLTAQWLSGDTHKVHSEITSLFHNPCFNITVDSTLPSESLNDILPVLTDNSSENFILQTTKGIITAHTRIASDNGIQVSSEIDLSMAAYQIANFIAKPAGLANRLYLKGDITEEQNPPLFSFKFLVDDNMTVSGTIKGWQSPVVEGLYTLKALDIASFEFPSLSPAIQLKGTCTGNGSFQFPVLPPSQFPLKGSLSIDGFEIGEKGAEGSLISVGVKTKLNGHHMSIEKGSASVGKTYFTVSGKLIGLLTPEGNLAVDVGFFDIDDFVSTIQRVNNLAKRKDKKAPSPGKNIFRRALLDIDLKVKKVNFLRWDFGSGTSRFSFKNGVMLWNDITIKADKGVINGAVLFDFSVPGTKKLKFMPSGSEADLRWFIPGFKKDKITTGTMNLTGTFTSTYNKAKDIIPNMEGSFHVSITDGKIGKFTVLSKILSMLNLARIIKLKVPDLFSKGMPFDSIESDFVMQDAIMKTDDFILMGSAMNLSAVGTINVLKEEVDFTVSAQLLKTIGKVLGNIPIAKDIFTGKNKALTIGYFHVKGPYKDISVKPLPRNLIDRAILKIFKKIIEIPRDIISPKHDDKHDEGTDNKIS